MNLTELKKLSLFQLIDLLENKRKSYSTETYKGCKEDRITSINKNYDDYILLDLKNWDSILKEKLLKNILIGINHFNLNLSYNKSFDCGAFNSVLDVITGKETIYVYKKTIKWFDEEIINKIQDDKSEFIVKK